MTVILDGIRCVNKQLQRGENERENIVCTEIFLKSFSTQLPSFKIFSPQLYPSWAKPQEAISSKTPKIYTLGRLLLVITNFSVFSK